MSRISYQSDDSTSSSGRAAEEDLSDGSDSNGDTIQATSGGTTDLNNIGSAAHGPGDSMAPRKPHYTGPLPALAPRISADRTTADEYRSHDHLSMIHYNAVTWTPQGKAKLATTLPRIIDRNSQIYQRGGQAHRCTLLAPRGMTGEEVDFMICNPWFRGDCNATADLTNQDLFPGMPFVHRVSVNNNGVFNDRPMDHNTFSPTMTTQMVQFVGMAGNVVCQTAICGMNCQDCAAMR